MNKPSLSPLQDAVEPDLSKIFPQTSVKLPEFPEIPDAPEIQEIEFITFTAEEIKSKSDDELKAILSGEYQPDKALSLPMQLLIDAELRERSVNNANKSNWMDYFNATIGIAGFLLALLGSWALIQEFLSQKFQLDALSQNIVSSQQSTSATTALPKPQERQQSISESLPPKQGPVASLKTPQQQVLKQEQGPPDKLPNKNSSIAPRTTN